ncbi:MAG: imidazolonepropionase [Planctomycetota bacterium]|nr:imidazolonepropionase [Planctomycetota bacterium]
MTNALSPVDLLVVNARQLVTSRGKSARGGSALGDVVIHDGGSLAVKGEHIVDVGLENELKTRWKPVHTLDADGGTIVPGFVDAHTHPVFFGTREDEFEMRTRGATYVEIGLAGGGILSSVRGVRTASKEQLLALLLKRLDRFLELGTTTIEAKTGYGLSTADEMKCLAVIAQAQKMHPVEIVPTFLGAHDYPLEFRDRKSAYVDLLVNEMLPAVAALRIAEYCDVFTEGHVFDLADSRRILLRAIEVGLRPRLHADQLSLLGGARLAAELRAASADHLEFVDDAGIDALLAAGVVPILCPVVPLYLRIDREAPGRRMIDRGLPVAVSTDFNPGSSYLQSMPTAMAWAALRYRMSAGEALTAGTLNAAASLDRAHRIGTLEAGKDADFLVLDVPDYRHLVYEHGRNAVRTVVKRGTIVWRRS